MGSVGSMSIAEGFQNIILPMHPPILCQPNFGCWQQRSRYGLARVTMQQKVLYVKFEVYC